MKTTILFLLLAGIAFCSSPVRAQAIAIPEAEKAAIVQTALDYGDGYYSGAAERMERALHPDLNKVWTRVLPQTKTVMIGYSTFSGLVEGTRAKMGYTEPAARKIQAEALFMNDDVAGAKVTSAQFNDFLQMVKVEGQWKIVNVLWVPGPESRFRQPLAGFIQEKEQAAAKKAAQDFMEGSMSGDVGRVVAVLHPEASRAVFQKLPQTEKKLVARNRFSGLVEPVRAQLTVIPEAQRQLAVHVIDMMDGMAFVEATTLFGSNYLLMSWLDGQWQILNILVRVNPDAPRPPQR